MASAKSIPPSSFHPMLRSFNLRISILARAQVKSATTSWRCLASAPSTGGSAIHTFVCRSDRRGQLTQDCAVILNWFAVSAIPDDCEFLLGDVPPKLMVQINSEYRTVLQERLEEHQGTLAQFVGLLGRRR